MDLCELTGGFRQHVSRRFSGSGEAECRELSQVIRFPLDQNRQRIERGQILGVFARLLDHAIELFQGHGQGRIENIRGDVISFEHVRIRFNDEFDF